MSNIHPYSWSEFPTEYLMYLLVMGVFHLIVFVVGCLVFAVLAIRHRGTFLRRVSRFGLFVGLLLIVGSLANGLWSCLVWGRLYFSTDYVFDFSPFWPITQGLVDAPFGNMRGQLLGASLFQLQLVWLLFAAATWAVTILLYRLICRRPPANHALQPTPGLSPKKSGLVAPERSSGGCGDTAARSRTMNIKYKPRNAPTLAGSLSLGR